MIGAAEDRALRVEVSGFPFVNGGSENGMHVSLDHTEGGQAALVHDCWFSAGGDMAGSMVVRTNRGVVYDCSFDTGLWTGRGVDNVAIQFTPFHAVSSWRSPDTMGDRDADGLDNFYVEDSRYPEIHRRTAEG